MKTVMIGLARTLVALGALALFASCRADVTVTVNTGARHQVIRGWGASTVGISIPDPVRNQILDAAVNELGLTRLRFEPQRGIGGPDWEPLNDDADPYHINWKAFNTFTSVKARDWVAPFKQRVEANGDPFTLYVSPSFFSHIPAPSWLINSPAEYAEWALAVLLNLKQQYGLTADYYSICNEAGNNNVFNPQLEARLIRELGPRLQAAGLKTRIEFPESVNPATAWSYIQALRDEHDFWPYIGLISYHLYGDRTQRPLIRDFAASRGLPTAQTEFMGTRVNDLYEDLTEGGVSYWEHYGLAFFNWPQGQSTGDYYSVDWALTAFTRYPEYWAFRQVMHYVRPGAVRVDALSDDPALRALAFTRAGKTTVVLLRTTPPWEPRTVTVRGLAPGRYGVSCTTEEGYSEMGVQDASNGILTVTVPSGRVLTIYPYAGANLAPIFTDWRSNPRFLTAPASAVKLFASATDPEKDALSYSWSVLSQPAGAQAALANPAEASTSVTGLTASGGYVFAVTVSDGAHRVEREVRLTRFAGNQPPELSGIHNRAPAVLTAPDSSTLLIADARDLERDPLTFRWSVVSQPAGAQAALETPDKPRTKANALSVAGDYVFRVEVSDGSHQVSKSITIKVWPPDQPPVISSALATLDAPGVAALAASTGDPDGDVVTHWWELKSAPEGARVVIETPGLPHARARGLTAPGDYVFVLTALDRTQLARREVKLTVPAG